MQVLASLLLASALLAPAHVVTTRAGSPPHAAPRAQTAHEVRAHPQHARSICGRTAACDLALHRQHHRT